MNITINFFSFSKIGNNEEENEDSFYPIEEAFDGNQFTISIADGASEGAFSSKWSKILTETCVKKNGLIATPEFLDESQNIFEVWKKDYIKKRIDSKNPLLWYEEMSLSSGAYSTLLGITFYHNKDASNIWESHAIGDSCLIQIRDEKVSTIFPILESIEFNNNPILISSIKDYNRETLKKIKNITYNWKYTDTFFLMTDAIAQWFYKEFEQDKKPWLLLNQLIDKNSLELYEWIKGQINEKKLKNDDITLIRLNLKE